MEREDYGDHKISIREIQRMIFVSNALNDGWTVKKVGNEKYEFTKDTETYEKDIETLDEFMKKNFSLARLRERSK